MIILYKLKYFQEISSEYFLDHHAQNVSRTLKASQKTGADIHAILTMTVSAYVPSSLRSKSFYCSTLLSIRG
jgi:hypothetical protein